MVSESGADSPDAAEAKMLSLVTFAMFSLAGVAAAFALAASPYQRDADLGDQYTGVMKPTQRSHASRRLGRKNPADASRESFEGEWLFYNPGIGSHAALADGYIL
jgi:hypothetical protein